MMQRHAIAALAAYAIVAAVPASAQEGGVLKGEGMVTRPSPYPVKETMDRVEASAKAIGAFIFNRIDFQEVSKKNADVDIRPNQLLIFGRGKGGPYIVREAPLAALDLPFKALAWEDARGKVWLTYTAGTYIDQRYAVKGAAQYVKGIDDTIEKLVADALR